MLGNFNYRKMSLVRDYDQLLEQDELSTPVFIDLFTARPREQAAIGDSVPVWPERHDVVPCDPTQLRAVAAASSGASFIIQGPPGTGKSQTITNLIADAIARNKRVLFICEKRAALDVVYHRLKQQGLDRLCCLIHDTQDDKKGFIADLKGAYEHFISTPDERQACMDARDKTVKGLLRGQEQWQRWGDELNAPDEAEGLSALSAIRRLVALDDCLPELSEDEDLPTWSHWQRGGESLRAVEAALHDLGADACLGRSPLRLLQRDCLLADQVVKHVQRLIHTANERVASCQVGLDPLAEAQGLQLDLSLQEFAELLAYADRIADLSQARLGSLLDPASPAVRDLHALVKDHQHLRQAVDQAKAQLTHWRTPFGAHEMADVLALCAKVEHHFLRFLMPGFWRLRHLMQERYDFSAHAIAPPWQRL